MRAVLSLGSNLGDRRAHLRAALDVVAQQVPVTAVSPLYETAPVGPVEQPWFLNCVAFVEVSGPEEALTVAHAAEDARGRLRATRWGPRSLDVDVVSVDAITSADPRLTLPHPQAHARAFVLVPWADLDGDAALPGRGPVRQLLGAVPTTELRRVSW